MGDIYLTKKERTTLYTEGFIFSLFIILASYLTIYGNIFVKMIPMLFFLGIIGNIVFSKPKTTVIFGTLSVLIIGLVTGFKINIDLLFTIIYSSIMIILGLIAGKNIHILYYSYKLKTFIGYNKKTVVILTLILSTFLALFLNNLVNSNPIQYFLVKNKVEKFITKNYSVKDYIIKDISYNINSRGFYTYRVDILGQNVILVEKSLNLIEDSNLDERKEKYSVKQNILLNEFKLNNSIDQELTVIGLYSYKEVSLYPNSLKIVIETGSSNNIDQKILDIIYFVNKLKTFEDYNKLETVNIVIDDKSINIPKEKIQQGLTKEYILNGLIVEYLD